jgi:four helix bundle protein
VSVPSNIAEGQGRLTPGEFKQFLSQARGSLMELETQLFISSTLGYVQREAHEELSDLIERLARMLNALISSIKVRAANAGNS